MKLAEDLIPWKVTDISLRPFKGMWSMNPSIHFDGDTWRCVVRCSDYAMPGGVTVRSERAKRGTSQTKNAMVIFDPSRWRPIEIYKMREYDDLPRATCGSVGYEDVRLFRTDREGLQGIAASLHLRRPGRRDQLAEQVLLSLDERYDIVEALPIRGDEWSRTPQKNWVPFDNTAEPRFLYAIDKGTMFGTRGELRGTAAQVCPSARPWRLRELDDDDEERERAADRADDAESRREREERKRSRVDFRSRAVAPTLEPPSGYQGLRGGSQLVRVGDDAWLGIGHSMTFVEKRKYYWHVWYLVDSHGRLRSASPAMKLVPNGIEFAAGIAVDGDRAVVSFGVDDMESRLAETRLSAVLDLLRPIGPT